MADGSHKSIEDITLDDQVRALDPETGQEGARPVTTLITGSGDKKLVAIDLDTDGDERADDRIHATDGHPFWVDQAQDWLRADELVARHALITPDGARVTVLAVLAYDAVATVHNLTVDDLHTYFVAAAGTEVLVHNCGGKHRDPDEAASTNDGYVGNHRAAGQHRVQEKPGLFTPRHEARPGHRALSLHDRSLPHRMGIYEGIARQDKFDNGAGRLFAMLPGSWSTYVSTSIRSYIFVRGYRAGYRSMTRAPASHQRGPIYRGRHRSYD
jgi:hypothetical protein